MRYGLAGRGSVVDAQREGIRAVGVLEPAQLLPGKREEVAVLGLGELEYPTDVASRNHQGVARVEGEVVVERYGEVVGALKCGPGCLLAEGTALRVLGHGTKVPATSPTPHVLGGALPHTLVWNCFLALLMSMRRNAVDPVEEDPDERRTPHKGECLDFRLVSGEVLRARRVDDVRLRGTKVLCDLVSPLGARESILLSCVESYEDPTSS